uniref:Probable dTDP-4-oxo-2,6-dideoxy-D-glucose 3,5-epimerase n=1 Tax=Streptomyces antibioticus TaxID=1890 RepID=OLEL_STRAT|nr:RecName: Full=Probable dTDP-4-oxo-2,6-dideoxy-D-glucose 3,5-epimerase [Streptomyces antibioticus]AAD55452.1 dTDP-4-keto-6-deoxyglucose 3,5-epimerase [Streptomyces antibioticus]
MELLDVDGAWLYTPEIMRDERGEFLEWFRGRTFQEKIGHPLSLAQANCSVSRKAFCAASTSPTPPPGQAKYVTCASGTVLDVVVDVRRGSPTFGRWAAVRLDAARHQGLYLAEGLGHAFMALTDDATVVYLCSQPYVAEAERAVDPLDPAIGIEWPTDIDIVPVGEGTPTHRPWRRPRRPGILPDYEGVPGALHRGGGRRGTGP